jgi:hypothetical protein
MRKSYSVWSTTELTASCILRARNVPAVRGPLHLASGQCSHLERALLFAECLSRAEVPPHPLSAPLNQTCVGRLSVGGSDPAPPAALATRARTAMARVMTIVLRGRRAGWGGGAADQEWCRTRRRGCARPSTTNAYRDDGGGARGRSEPKLAAICAAVKAHPRHPEAPRHARQAWLLASSFCALRATAARLVSGTTVCHDS